MRHPYNGPNGDTRCLTSLSRKLPTRYAAVRNPAGDGGRNRAQDACRASRPRAERVAEMQVFVTTASA